MRLRVNGQDHDVDVPEDMPLLWVLRDVLGLTGTKFGCGMAQCGACTVHVGDGPARSCVLPGRRGRASAPSPRSRACPRAASTRCSRPGSRRTSCSAATASPARSWPRPRCSRRKPKPTDADIDAALSANLCRCGTYQRIRAAVHRAAGQTRRPVMSAHRHRPPHVPADASAQAARRPGHRVLRWSAAAGARRRARPPPPSRCPSRTRSCASRPTTPSPSLLAHSEMGQGIWTGLADARSPRSSTATGRSCASSTRPRPPPTRTRSSASR